MRALILIAAVSLLAVSASAGEPKGLPAEVTTQKDGYVWKFTDAKGMTLYTFDRDGNTNTSTCNAKCLEIWHPLAAPADAKIAGDWSLVMRKDGPSQWAYQGKPLYTYFKDTHPGAAFGDRRLIGNGGPGDNDRGLLFRVAVQPIAVPPGISIAETVVGRVLTNAKGMTLYARKGDMASAKSSCTAKCIETWVPVAAPWLATGMEDWSTFTREDGAKQWAYQGQPLYSYAADLKPGDANGTRIDSAWQAVVLLPPLPLPSWVTVQQTDMGLVYADAKGLSLYLFEGDLEKVKRLTCDDSCIKSHWRQVVAAADAKPVGNWSIIPGDGGASVWAYKGGPVYLYARDTEAGDINGDKFAAGDGKLYSAGWWRPALRWPSIEEL